MLYLQMSDLFIWDYKILRSLWRLWIGTCRMRRHRRQRSRHRCLGTATTAWGTMSLTWSPSVFFWLGLDSFIIMILINTEVYQNYFNLFHFVYQRAFVIKISYWKGISYYIGWQSLLLLWITIDVTWTSKITAV